MFQTILSAIVLAAGVLYALYFLIDSYRDRETVKTLSGDLRKLIPIELIVYFISSLGVSDILQNTPVVNRYRLCRDEELPGTLVGCGIVPGAIMAFGLLRAGTEIGFKTVAVCGVFLLAGVITGGRLVSKMGGRRIKQIMQIALVVSFVFLIVKIIVSSGSAGTGTGLSGISLLIAVVVCFFSGIFNMFGIPMKPTWTAMFLIMGLSPIVVLTLTLVFGAIAPLTGGINIIRSGKYNKKMVFAAVTGGSAGAILGTAFAVSLPAAVLNVLLIGVMLIAIISMFRKK